MKPAPFAYAAPKSLADALALLRGDPDARVLAGGQSLVPMLALRLARPSLLVDLNRVDGLAGIAVERGVVRIGALTRQAAVLASAEVAAHAPLLVQALGHVGHPPTRARGTIGGSLAHADPAAELPVACVALGAVMIVAMADGERRIPAADFFLGTFETALRPGEILVAIEVPRQAGGSAFVEVALRHGDFALAAAACRVALAADGTCSSASIVLGGVAGGPVRCVASEVALVGQPVDKATPDATAVLPLDEVVMSSPTASANYRRRLAVTLVKRALAAAAVHAAEGGR